MFLFGDHNVQCPSSTTKTKLTEFITATECWSSVVDATWQSFQKTNRYITVLKGKGLAKITTGGVHSGCVRSKVAGAVEINNNTNPMQVKAHLMPYSAY